MKKRYFFIILTLFVSFFAKLNAQNDLWKTHFSYESNISSIERAGDLVYAVSDGKLFSYNSATKAYATYVKGENNSDIKQISFNLPSNSLLLIRDNFDIDVVSGSTFYNVPALKNTNLNLDKTINHIFMHGDFAYLSTGFGMMVVDMRNKEIKQTCLFSYPIYASTFYDNKLYAVSSKGVMAIDINKNMQDDKNWDAVTLSDKYSYSDYQFADTEIRNLGVYEGKLHFLVPSKALYVLSDGVVDRLLAGLTPEKMVCRDNKLVVFKTNMFWHYTALKTSTQVASANLLYVTPDAVDLQFWLATATKQLSLVKSNSGVAQVLSTNLRPAGPLMNVAFAMSYTGGKIRVVRGGYHYDRYFVPGELSELDNGSWFNYLSPNIARDFSSVVSNPLDPDNLFVPTWGQGVYEFNDKKYVKIYNESNSTLRNIVGAASGYLRVNGLAFDKNNRFWVCNSRVENIMHVFEKTGSTWTSKAVYYPEIDKTLGIVNHLLIDRNNNKWIVAMGAKSYLFIFNENGTIDDTSDDKKKFVEEFYDQSGQRVKITDIYSSTEDLNGNVWLTTSSGVFVINRSDDIFNEDIVFNKVEIAKNDGTAFTEYFLENTYVTKMIVDKANRKWIATDAFGVYLLSADGQTVIHNFTMENSPLPSDKVLSVAIDDVTGDVYFGTDRGVAAFSGAAVSAADRVSSVFSFPNPVSADYVGDVTIRGCEINSVVKITDEHNNVLSQGLATKGEYKWSMTDLEGKPVRSGVYFAFGKDESGKQGLLTKIRVTN